MEKYFDKNGKLLPTFYKDPKWKIMEAILLTVFDCACCIATWGLAIYLVFLKSIFIIAYSLIIPPSSDNVERPKENLEKQTQTGTGSAATRPAPSGQRPFLFSVNEDHLKRSRPSTPESKAAQTNSGESSKTRTPQESEASLEDEIVRKLSEARAEPTLPQYEFQDPVAYS